MDPGLPKLISPPFSKDDLGVLLFKFSLRTVEIIFGCGATSAEEFVSKLIAFTPALAPVSSMFSIAVRPT